MNRWERRFARLLWAGTLYVLGLIPWWYRHGHWLPDFDAFWTSSGERGPFVFVWAFEKYRTYLAKQFKATELPMPADQVEAAKLWREPSVLCHLFSFIARRELHPLRFLRWMRWLPLKGEVLEFGAGAAPLADALDKRWPFPRPTITVADIPWCLHDYQKWRFRGVRKTRIMTLRPDGPIMAAGGVYDGILCVETLEHVPDPMRTARQLITMLKPGGTLVCDYGPQTKNQALAPMGMSLRTPTLNFLKHSGEILQDGELLVIRKPRKR